MNPPTAVELVGPPPLGPDQKWALKNFLGKTQSEAQQMCRESSAVTEDFTYMTGAGLCYYLPAALAYLESDESAGDWDFAHGLMCALSSQVSICGMSGEALNWMRQIADHCDRNRAKFDLTPEDLFDGYLRIVRSA